MNRTVDGIHSVGMAMVHLYVVAFTLHFILCYLNEEKFKDKNKVGGIYINISVMMELMLMHMNNNIYGCFEYKFYRVAGITRIHVFRPEYSAELLRMKLPIKTCNSHRQDEVHSNYIT